MVRVPTLEEQFLADERARIERERERARQARAAASIAQPANPQRTADVNRLARDVGQPPAVVEEQYAAMTQYRRARAAREAARKQPVLGDWLGDERNAALAQDDVGILEGIGDTVAGWLRSSGVSRQMVENAERGVFASDARREDGFFDRMGSLIERGGAAVDEGIYNFIAGTTGSNVARNAARTLSRGTTGQEVGGQTTWEAVKNAPTLSNIGAYLIDANRLLRHPKVSGAMLNYYGPEVMEQFRRGIEDVAAGDAPAQDAWERGINHIRMGATVAGLGWNLKTALLQPFGLTQSIVRVGAPWIARGASQFFASPLETSRAVYERSRFMRERSNTMQREINEIRNRIRGGTQAGEFLNASFFFMITRTQLAIDLPTWQGAYEKAIAEGRDDDMAVSLADQAVRDAQGGGQVGDLSAIQRGGPVRKLFTNFYSFFNTTYNLTAESYARTDFRKPGDVMALALDYLLLYSLPAAMGYFLDLAFSGEDEDDRTLIEGLASEHISYLTGTMVGLRELDAPIQNVGEALTGAELNEYDFGYTGPAGLRFFADGTRAAQQASQGEFDEALRKSMINTGGILFHLPSGQINKTIDGATAIANDDTDNPMALVSGN